MNELKLNHKKFVKSIDKGEGSYKIYAVISIDTQQVIYVGITKTTLGTRLSAHKTYLDNRNICISLITKTDNKSLESYYINLFTELGCDLLNKNKGISDKIKVSNIRKKMTADDKKRYAKEYYEKNKVKLIESMREYQSNNIDKLREYRKEYYSNYY